MAFEAATAFLATGLASSSELESSDEDSALLFAGALAFPLTNGFFATSSSSLSELESDLAGLAGAFMFNFFGELF